MLTFKKRLWFDRFETIRKYYKSPKFALLDLIYTLIALLANPYRTCRKYNQKIKAPEIYTYGETPFSTYEKIARAINLKASDTWIEIGSGRGRGCFWLNHFFQCKTLGIERVPQFVFLSNFIKKLFFMRNVCFLNENVEEIDLKEANYIYLYGIWPKLNIPKETKIITISEPLEGFDIIQSFWVRFPWGRTRAYVQCEKNICR